MKIGSFINWPSHIPDINTSNWFFTNGHFLLLKNGAYPDITAQNRAVQNPTAEKAFQSFSPLLMNIFLVLAIFLKEGIEGYSTSCFFNKYFWLFLDHSPPHHLPHCGWVVRGKQLTGQKSLLLESEGSTICTICCIKTLNTLAIY